MDSEMIASDDTDDEEKPIAELRASLSNLCNPDMFTPLPDKAHKFIISYLPRTDIQNCRLVSRTWNAIFAAHITFFAQFSDLTKYTFLDIPSTEKLIVATIIVRNFTKHLKNPLNPVEILQNFSMRSPKDVKKIIFRDGVSEECRHSILEAYRFVEELNFHLVPFPTLPQYIVFSHCKILEITTKNYSSGNETKAFFSISYFPSLENLKLKFYSRDDIQIYLGAHFFAASHHKTLKKLTLNFGYYLSDVEKYSKDEASARMSSKLKSKAVERDAKPKEKEVLKKEPQYKKFLTMIPLMKLETLNLNFSLHEGQSPWNLSFKLLDAQTHLKVLNVEYPFVLKNKYYNFHGVIKKNQSTLKKISIPCLQDFDCSILKDCPRLESFSIGKEFSFNYLFFGSRGSLVNFAKFPSLETIKSLSICVPLKKVEIRWLSSAIPANSLLVYGVETDEDYFACCEIIDIVHERRKLKKLMMRIYMDDDENKKLSEFFEWDYLIVSDYFHAENCGFTTFIVEPFLETDPIEGTMEGGSDGGLHEGHFNSRTSNL